jgi:glycosyltransferase involved in cell wall biosynthesis
MAVSDIFVLPSRQENFALAVAEAMKMNIPVIISDKVDTWPYIKEAEAGIVLSLDEQNEWPVVINDLLLDDTKRMAMGDNAAKLAFEKFSWDSSTARLAEVYDSVYKEIPA